MSDKIKIIFSPNSSEEDLESGLLSEISWGRLRPFIAEAIGLKTYETLVGITVTQDGIKARLKTNP